MAELRRGPFILLFAVDRQLSDLLAAAMADSPLRPSDFAVTSMMRLTGPVRPGELAALVGLRPTSLSNYLKRFTEAGLVRRRRDPADGRAVLVTLTPKGLRLTEACFPGFAGAIESFRAALRDQGIVEDDLLNALEGVSRALAAAAAGLEQTSLEVG